MRTNASKWLSKIQTRKYPFFWVIFILYAVGSGIEWFNDYALKFINKDEGMFVALSTNWYSFWIGSTFFGLAIGFVKYFIFGWLHSLRIHFSEGIEDYELSQHLNLYCSIAYIMPTILLTIIQTIIYDNPIQPHIGSAFHIVIYMSIDIIGYFASILLNYQMAIKSFDINVTKAKIFFVLLPALLYYATYMSKF